MKKIIDTLLRTGMSKTKKYKVADFPYFLHPIFEDIEDGIKANNNIFWKKENTENRNRLRRDIKHYCKSISKGTTYNIINEYENGHSYGIDK